MIAVKMVFVEFFFGGGGVEVGGRRNLEAGTAAPDWRDYMPNVCLVLETVHCSLIL